LTRIRAPILYGWKRLRPAVATAFRTTNAGPFVSETQLHLESCNDRLHPAFFGFALLRHDNAFLTRPVAFNMLMRLPALLERIMRRKSNGQILVILALGLPVLLGAVALGTDVTIFYFNWVQLQKAADSAVLAGANYLPDNPPQAQTTADQIAENNGVKSGEIVSTTVSSNDLLLSITLTRTVPYFLAKVLGLTSGVVTTSATATPQNPPSTVNAATSSQIPSGGDSNGANGTTCASIGSCGLIPIGLDSNTVYQDKEQLTLQQGQLGPGNWDLLALGGTGGANLRTNIADGYNSMVSVGDWVTTEPGKKVGPVDQGFQDRLDAAASNSNYSSGTYSSHNVNDPRVLVLPVVDWEHPNGRSSVKVTAFATVWLDSYSSGQVTVNFISQVIANSFGDPNAPYFGSRGTPILVK
jgi:Flp pilus assembly protein TadG